MIITPQAGLQDEMALARKPSKEQHWKRKKLRGSLPQENPQMPETSRQWFPTESPKLNIKEKLQRQDFPVPSPSAVGEGHMGGPHVPHDTARVRMDFAHYISYGCSST